MSYYADLHIHSRYARACSPQLTLENIDLWCRIKGISIVNCADFTHPVWFSELEKKLEPEGNGFYRLKPSLRLQDSRFKESEPVDVHFIMGTEVACIYSHNKITRRIHHCIYAPTLAAVDKINKKLIERGGKLKSDGRPILGLSSQALLGLILEADERNVLIPAHIWTPWFAIFGSKSGYNSVEECFGDLSQHIFALETGLSSDPAMNWRVSQNDKYTLVSHSDAHSLPNIGREADIFSGQDLSYDNLVASLKSDNLNSKNSFKLDGTIEFFPDEGRYHYDGHRDCKISFSPEETKKYQGLCPNCDRPLTIGVVNRVEELADRGIGFKPKGVRPFVSLIELDKVIAQAQGVKGRQTKAVEEEYWGLVSQGGGELRVLLEQPLSELATITNERVVEAIKRLRQGRVDIKPGYDGVYGVVNIFSNQERIRPQASLF